MHRPDVLDLNNTSDCNIELRERIYNETEIFDTKEQRMILVTVRIPGEDGIKKTPCDCERWLHG